MENIQNAPYLRNYFLTSKGEGEPQYSRDTKEPFSNWAKTVKLDIMCKAYKKCSKRPDYFKVSSL